MALSNAERQAAYRLRHRPEAEKAPKAVRDANPRALDVAEARIRVLEEEIRHLKRELSLRNPPAALERPFGYPRPAPKPSQSSTSGSGRRI